MDPHGVWVVSAADTCCLFYDQILPQQSFTCRGEQGWTVWRLSSYWHVSSIDITSSANTILNITHSLLLFCVYLSLFSCEIWPSTVWYFVSIATMLRQAWSVTNKCDICTNTIVHFKCWCFLDVFSRIWLATQKSTWFTCNFCSACTISSTWWPWSGAFASDWFAIVLISSFNLFWALLIFLLCVECRWALCTWHGIYWHCVLDKGDWMNI